MIYTINLDFYVDDNKILTDEDLSEILKELINSTGFTVANVKIIDIND